MIVRAPETEEKRMQYHVLLDTLPSKSKIKKFQKSSFMIPSLNRALFLLNSQRIEILRTIPEINMFVNKSIIY